VANVTASRVSSTAQRKFRVFQAAQYLSMDFGSGEVRLMTKKDGVSASGMPEIENEIWNLEKGDALLAETSSFVQSIIQNREPVVTGRDGIRALELAETIIGCINSRS
jgi:predicted dehydrogenase